MIKAVLREPFFHFIFIGALLYLVYASAGPDGQQKQRIYLSKAEVLQIKEQWKKRWGRDPYERELQSLIAKKQHEKMLFEEALAMRLERDDSIIYERLVEKTRLVLKNIRAAENPDDAVLEAYYQMHRDDYRIGGTFSFYHAFVNLQQQDAYEKANEMLSLLKYTLAEPQDARHYADNFPHANHVTNATSKEISKTYGSGFAQQLTSLKKGSWQGPLISQHGLHLIYITERSGGTVPDYASVRYRVESDFLEDYRQKAYHKASEQIRLKYDLVME